MAGACGIWRANKNFSVASILAYSPPNDGIANASSRTKLTISSSLRIVFMMPPKSDFNSGLFLSAGNTVRYSCRKCNPNLRARYHIHRSLKFDSCLNILWRRLLESYIRVRVDDGDDLGIPCELDVAARPRHKVDAVSANKKIVLDVQWSETIVSDLRNGFDHIRSIQNGVCGGRVHGRHQNEHHPKFE